MGDRFVSAFRWRSIVLCRPDDTRNSAGKATKNPEENCKTSAAGKREERMLRETYRSDPNVKAEALCGDGGGHGDEGDDDEREDDLRRRAVRDYSTIYERSSTNILLQDFTTPSVTLMAAAAVVVVSSLRQIRPPRR